MQINSKNVHAFIIALLSKILINYFAFLLTLCYINNMKRGLFAENYPPNNIYIPPDSDGTNLARSIRWSATFGESLHNYLLGDPSDIPDIEEYYAWMRDDYPKMERRLLENHDQPDKAKIMARGIGDLTFHIINKSLIPLFNVRETPNDTKANKNDRRMNIALCQANIAVNALVWCQYRSDLEEQGLYYSEEFEEYRGVIQGRLAEFDATAALLNYIRHTKPGYNLFASPAQFERGPESAKNSDLIVVNPESDQAIGVQVKSRVTKETVGEYDPRMIVLLDGQVDLGGHKYVRLKDVRGHITEPIKFTYGGMLAIEYLTKIPPLDMPVLQHRSGLHQRTYLVYGMKAKKFREEAGFKNSFMPQASNNVGDRIGHHLQP